METPARPAAFDVRERIAEKKRNADYKHQRSKLVEQAATDQRLPFLVAE